MKTHRTDSGEGKNYTQGLALLLGERMNTSDRPEQNPEALDWEQILEQHGLSMKAGLPPIENGLVYVGSLDDLVELADKNGKLVEHKGTHAMVRPSGSMEGGRQ